MNLMVETLKIFSENQDKIAIVDQKGRGITFQDFNNRLHQVCNQLRQSGITKGDKILLLTPVSIDLYLLIGAIFKLGAVVVFIDPWAKKEYIKRALEKVNPDHVIFNNKAKVLLFLIKELKEIATKHSAEKLLSKSYNMNCDSGEVVDVLPSDSALITFTTGSSSSPKGFDRTHEFLLAQRDAHGKYFKHNSEGFDLCMFPVFVLSNLAHGLSSVLVDADLRNIAKNDPSKLIKQIRQHKVTSLTCSPALCLLITRELLRCNEQINEIEFLYTGGAPVHPDLFTMLNKVMPRAKKYLVYGSTEAEPIALLDSDTLLDKTRDKTIKGEGTALGRPVEDINLKVIKPSTGVIEYFDEVGENEIGEVIVTGDFVGKKYYKSPEAFKKNKIVENENVWHRTGDHGYFEDGILYMMGREHNIVFENDKKWYPLQIEPIIDAMNEVEKSAIFQYRFNEIGVLIKLKNGVSQYDVRHEINQVISSIGISPKVVHFVKDIPVDPRHNSKIDVHAIKATFSHEEIERLKSFSLLERFKMYTDERFPVLATAVFVFLFSFNSFYLFDALNEGNGPILNSSMIIGYVTMFLVFFHLRLMDEFKDYKDDVLAYPERVLSRGVIKLKEFKIILSLFFVLEIVLNLYLGKAIFINWLLVFIYSILMYKEFFVPDWLEKRLGVYLISHQLILPLMVFYMFSIVSESSFFKVENLIATVFVASLSFYYEIARKTWSKDREQAGADSYTSVWGIKKSVVVLFLANLANLSCSIFLLITLKSSWIFYLPLFFIQLFSMYSNFLFLNEPSSKNSKLVDKIGTGLLLGGHFFMIFITRFSS